MNFLPRNVSYAVTVSIKPDGPCLPLMPIESVVCEVLTVKLRLSACKTNSNMASRVSIHGISSYAAQNLSFPVVSAFSGTSGRSCHAKALLSSDGSAVGGREEDVW